MDLLSLTNAAIDVVNPRILLSIQIYRGTGKDEAFRPVPLYDPPILRMGQVQSMEWRDIQMLDGLNLQGTRRKIYIYGALDGIVRATDKGGDLITDPNCNVWLVAQVLEHWEGRWCAVAATLQNESED